MMENMIFFFVGMCSSIKEEIELFFNAFVYYCENHDIYIFFIVLYSVFML
jgi:hypothetical protein